MLGGGMEGGGMGQPMAGTPHLLVEETMRAQGSGLLTPPKPFFLCGGADLPPPGNCSIQEIRTSHFPPPLSSSLLWSWARAPALPTPAPLGLDPGRG